MGWPGRKWMLARIIEVHVVRVRLLRARKREAFAIALDTSNPEVPEICPR
jgi:hypothetical protein